MALIGSPTRPYDEIAVRSDIGSLAPDLSAEQVLSGRQRVVLAAISASAVLVIAVRVLTGIGPSLLWWAQMAILLVTVVYIAVISFKGMLIHGAQRASVLQFTTDELYDAPNAELPVYTVLVPLYREGAVLPALVQKLDCLDY